MSSLRTVQGVIAGFLSLVFVLFVGSGVFYKILDTQDPATMPVEWGALYTALDTVFGIGIGVWIFCLGLFMLIPVLWIFLGKKGREDRL